jgi:hypothetical protein
LGKTMVSRVKNITQNILIPATAPKVYRAVVNPPLRSAFTGARAAGSARAGARFTARDGYYWDPLKAFITHGQQTGGQHTRGRR